MKHIAEALVAIVFIVAIAYSLTNCTSQEIISCGNACEESGKKMLKYNKTEGCVCEDSR